jgi:hypothetical protein
MLILEVANALNFKKHKFSSRCNFTLHFCQLAQYCRERKSEWEGLVIIFNFHLHKFAQKRDKNRPSENDEKKLELCNELRKKFTFRKKMPFIKVQYSSSFDAAALLPFHSVESALNIDAFAYWLSSFSFTSPSCLAKHQETNSLEGDREAAEIAFSQHGMCLTWLLMNLMSGE